MADPTRSAPKYFVFDFPLADQAWLRYGIASLVPGKEQDGAAAYAIRKLAAAVNDDAGRKTAGRPPTHAETLLALRTLNQVLKWVALRYFRIENPGGLSRCRQWATQRLGPDAVDAVMTTFVDLFPPLEVKRADLTGEQFLAGALDDLNGRDLAALEMFLLFLNVNNPAAAEAEHLFHDGELRRRVSYLPFVTGLEKYLTEFEVVGTEGVSLPHLLRAPLLASPDSLAGQLAWIRDHWAHLLPDELRERLQFALDVLQEVDVARGGEPGPAPVLEFGPGPARDEPEAFSRDADWMANVVLMAKSVSVWLDQLSKWYGRPLRTLADIPDEELDRLAHWGINGLWLIGLWERSAASRTIKQWLGNPDAAASAYSLADYAIASDLGGEEAWRNLSERAGRRGIRLASDMVPNHMGIDSRWVVEHPEYFLQLDHPPYPAYRFGCEDLCGSPGVSVRLEDGYWDKRDAAVVFERRDDNTGRVRYIYHGNDGTSMPWNDTAQLNFLLPQVREAVIRVILDVARRFPIIRFDAAMTLAKKHFQRLWFPAPGDAGAIPSRAEHGMSREEFDRVFPAEFWREVVDRVAAEAPDTLLLAEAFWLMEGYFVRTLGMHRVYNSAFMNMLKMEDNQKYRQTLKNVLEFSPGILQRFVNFMNNPDERTAVEQFGRGDKYFGCMVLLATLPGLPMIGHGQIEGFTEKYGMEYRRAYWDEKIDREMVDRHERAIFPLLRRRHLFSGSENFALFDFESEGGWVDENVFAFVNGSGTERVLVIYNNAYDGTAGRIRTSTAINRGSADHPDLQSVTLAGALGLDCSGTSWYALTDHADGLQYLRGGRELCEQGLHTDLHGYQYRAFIQMTLLDGDPGRWADLADSLQGRGAPDLRRELLRRELDPVLSRVRTWMTPEILAWLEYAGATDQKPEPAKVPRDLPENLVTLATHLRALPRMKIPVGLGRGSRTELIALLENLPHSRCLQVIYLAELLGTTGSEKIGLDGPGRDLVTEDMGAILKDWLGHDHAAAMATASARLLAAHADSYRFLAEGKISWLADILTDPAAAELLGINTHEQTVYLSAERLDDWLQVVTSAALAHESDVDFVALLDARSVLLQKAKAAGYEVRELLRLLNP